MIYLDEYLVAADRLEESGSGFLAVASALRDMHDRVVKVFCDSESGPRVDAREPVVVDGHLVATDMRILIRMPTGEPETELTEVKRRIPGLLAYIAKWLEFGEGAWHPMRQLVPGDDDLWERRVKIANRDISGEYVRRINLLPEPEYLDDCADYVGVYAEQPLRFRFRCGEGIVMPLRPHMTADEVSEIIRRGSEEASGLDASLTENRNQWEAR